MKINMLARRKHLTASRKFTLAIVLFAALAAMTASASAESLLASATRSGNNAGATTAFAVLNGTTGATSLAFSTSAANKLVKITYNAECGVLGPVGSWQSVTILVDGVEANPASNVLFAFCSATSTSSYTWVGAVRQSLIKVPAKGAHSVQVQVSLGNSATGWWLGDSSIVVEQQ